MSHLTMLGPEEIFLNKTTIVQPGIQFQTVLSVITSTKITFRAYFLLLSASL